MGVHYVQVARWDSGQHDISTPHLVTACSVLDCTADSLLFGHTRRPTEPAAAYGDAGIRSTLAALGATPEVRAALGEHLESKDGRLQEVTRVYVERWVRTYVNERARGTDRRRAIELAYQEAIQGDATVSTVAAGVNIVTAAPPTPTRRKPQPRARKRLDRTIGGVVVPSSPPPRGRK